MSGPFRNLPSTTEILQPSGRVKLRAHKLRIEVLAGPNVGQVLDLPGFEVRVGSAPGSDLLLLDTAVSRHHLTLRLDTVGARVVDAGSSNGTFVDGTRIRDAYARPDSSIVLGNTTLRLRVLDDFVELPLSDRQRFGGLLGKSALMRQVFTVLERVAPVDDTVLIEGETGTGKEITAEAIHEQSPRASGPFVVFDCSAVSKNLVESELFGHVKGAFTGAIANREGALEAAEGGTLFIDELGELPLELQPKLLRAIERREVRRVGSNTSKQVDVRIVAATNKNLAEEVAAERFREDLYYRIAVVRVVLPPLRERPEDIPLLVQHFCEELSRRGRAGASLPEQTTRAFVGRAWPGNVRELRNAVARALSLGVPVSPSAASMPPPGEVATPDVSVPFKTARERMIEAFERAYLTEALRLCGGNITRAAEMARVDRKLVQRAVRRYGLRGESE